MERRFSPNGPIASTSPVVADYRDMKKICVIGWGLMGDLFIRIPLIEALKRRFPQAAITVVVDPGSQEVLANHPYCGELVVYSRKKRPLLDYLRSAAKTIRYLRSRRFDLLVNLYSGGSSPLVTLLVNAPIRLGFDHTWKLRLANNVRVRYPPMCGNWSKDLGTVLGPLGIPADQIRRGTSFSCTPEAVKDAAGLLGQDAQEYVGFNLGARAPEKRWPVERFIELALRICGKHDLIPLVFTNPGMEHLADEFAAQYGEHARVVQAPILSLDRVARLMTRCSYIVTGDTALMHLAFGLKRPTMVLFTHTRPEVVSPEDCPHTACFVEDPSHLDPCGNPLGTIAIPLDLAEMRFDELVKIVRRQAHIATNGTGR